MTPEQKRQMMLARFHPLSMIRMVWRHKTLVVACGLVLTAIAAYFVANLPDVYRAEAVILVDSQKIPEKFVASTVQVSLQDSLNAISQQVLNSRRLQGIVDDFHLYPAMRGSRTPDEMVERLRKDLTVTLERGISGNRSGAFRIAYEGANPQLVANIVSRLSDLFVQENLRSREQRAAGTSEFIETELQQAKAQLDQLEAAESKFKTRWAGELPEQQSAILSTLTTLRTELQGNADAISRVNQTRAMLESSLRFAESSLASALRNAAPPASGAMAGPPGNTERPVIPRRGSVALQAQLTALRQRYFDEHPEVKRVRIELAQALAEEAAAPPPEPDANTRVARLEPGPADSGTPPEALAEINRERERINTARTQLELVTKEIEEKSADRRRILREIQDHQARVEKLPLREQQMAGLTRDYDNAKLNYRSLLDKKMAAEMAANMERSQQSERFTIADPARVPDKPSKPRRVIYYGVSALGSLAIGIALALLLEMRRNAFLGEWELPSNLKVIGRIPNVAPAAIH